MEASSSEQQFCLRWNNHRTNLLTAFTELFHNGAFTDVELLVEGESSLVPFKCHKMVLAACSNYFQEIFSYTPTEHYPIIVLTNVREAEMKAILEFMYQGEISVSQEEMTDIFKVARMLKIKGLAEYEKSHRSRGRSASPPPAISSTERSASFGNESLPNDYRSPPHSTSSSSFYPSYGKASALVHNPAAHIAPTGWSPLASLSLAAQSVMSAPLTPRAAALFPGVYETEANHLRKQMSNLIMNRDTPILRTVLGQGQADSSQGLPPSHGDGHDVYRSSSNGSAHDMTDDRKSSMDLSQGRNGSGHSPYSADISMDEFDKKSTGQQNRKNKEWKRYKQYTKEHMEKAIIAVQGGETALKASKAYGIPSRTLYDKVKKMGITTQRNIRRHRTSSGAHFPHGIGGNRNGSIYRSLSDHDTDNDYGRSMIEGSSALLDIAYGHGREQTEDQEASLDNSRISTSPDEEQREEMKYDSEDHVQDLSINRRNVIVPPSNPPIKEENDDDASKN
ncbi:broad-complex core protein isoforms 1/2/3/4/5-like [Diachasma alloeum]|uniref:broad-complex core protein isoforms 1/2/3/4/5-like n=1 Tax=Diachasma alloeum TaxID=454923 RepID=UPI0010FB0221|nr:broad-complex core protein isoforms 1/2/3/4/5-like [Diachasma alloeum]